MDAETPRGDGVDRAATAAALAAGAPVNFEGVTVTRAELFGRVLWFATDVKRDPIQRCHRQGTFYEMPELEALSRHVPLGGVFVDIGANVGNHALFAALFLNSSRVIPVEPNPRCYRLLWLDALMNGVAERYDLSHLGMGLSDREAGNFGLEARERNLGATKMLEGEGEIPVTTGDLAFADVTPDFIKVDVEGMEMQVLRGLEATLARARPKMLIEVDRENYDAFDAWVSQVGYEVIETHQRYQSNKNFLIGPGEA